MGTICAKPVDKDECNQTDQTTRKNLVQFRGTLAKNVSVDLTLGHYRQSKGQSLLVIIQSKNLHHCDPLKDYSNDCAKTIELIQNMRKTFFKPTVNKNCPYKNLFLCMLPNYRSEGNEEYKQLFINLLRQALEETNQIAVQFVHTIQGVHTLPNQLIIGLMLKELIDWKQSIKLNLIATQKKMMSFYRHELMKTEKFTLGLLKQ